MVFITKAESHPESGKMKTTDFQINLAKQLKGNFQSKNIAINRTSVAPVTQDNIETHRLLTLKRKTIHMQIL